MKIGKQLMQLSSNKELEENIYTITNFINSGSKHIQIEDEIIEIVMLNMMAGKKAKLSGVFELALEYFYIPYKFLTEKSWEKNPHFMMPITREIAECEYLIGNYKKAEQLIQLSVSKLAEKENQQVFHDLKAKYS